MTELVKMDLKGGFLKNKITSLILAWKAKFILFIRAP